MGAYTLGLIFGTGAGSGSRPLHVDMDLYRQFPMHIRLDVHRELPKWGV